MAYPSKDQIRSIFTHMTNGEQDAFFSHVADDVGELKVSMLPASTLVLTILGRLEGSISVNSRWQLQVHKSLP